MNNTILLLKILLLTLFIAGCSSLPIPNVTKYSLDTPVTKNNNIEQMNIAVQRVRGRHQYDKKSLSISPEPHVMDTYQTAQWAESPCSMLTDNIIAYLSEKFSYVTSMPNNYNNELDYIISVYIDELNQIKRDGKWFAVISLHYEIISSKTRKTVKNNRFRKKVGLSDSSVQTYVDAQNKSVDKFLQLLTSEILKQK